MKSPKPDDRMIVIVILYFHSPSPHPFPKLLLPLSLLAEKDPLDYEVGQNGSSPCLLVRQFQVLISDGPFLSPHFAVSACDFITRNTSRVSSCLCLEPCQSLFPHKGFPMDIGMWKGDLVLLMWKWAFPDCELAISVLMTYLVSLFCVVLNTC